MESIRMSYLKHIIFVGVYPTEKQNFSAEAQIAGPSGFIHTNVPGDFETAISAKEFATNWAKQWIDSGCTERPLADAFIKLRA